ncbi:hypothetical protein [Microbulbifer sp. SAOS-129_SWC]|uniref:hypothetical protein n=1 Tax=Microbulbifer sp. SAOS-129_SWC TaxID=3145235 RepID=UPI0032167F76
MEIEAYNLIRMMIVAISGLSIFFGYRLFTIVTERQGQLKIAQQETSLELSDIGPGVFFSLFGSIVLIAVLWTQPYKQTDKKTNKNGETISERYPAMVSDTQEESSKIFQFDYDLVCVDSDSIEKFSEGVALLDTLSQKKVSDPYGKLSEEIKKAIQNIFLSSFGDGYKEIEKDVNLNVEAYNLIGSYLTLLSLKNPC